MKAFFSILLVSIISTGIFANSSDSLISAEKHPICKYYFESDFPFLASALPDSVSNSLNNSSHRYFTNNFPYEFGLITRSLFYSPVNKVGFKLGMDDLDIFGFNRSAVKYFNSRAPFTEVSVVFGSKKEQYSKLTFTQNISKRWNIAFTMLRMRSDGFYLRQSGNDNNLLVSTNYMSKNNRYGLLANGISHSVKTFENGGIKNDSVFESKLVGDKKFLPVNLLVADSRKGYREVFVKQFLNFGKSEILVMNDSVSYSRIIPKHSLSYTFRAQTSWFNYRDDEPKSGYYENVYWDTLHTNDSTHVTSFENEIAWKSQLTRNLTTEISYSKNTYHVFQFMSKSIRTTDTLIRVTDTVIRDEIIRLKLGNDKNCLFDNGLRWNIFAAKVVKGVNQNDQFVDAYIGYQFHKSNKIFLQFENSLVSSPFTFTNFTSNNFWWRNSFEKIRHSVGEVHFNNSKLYLSLGVKYYQIGNYIYYDSKFTPVQVNDVFNVITTYVEKKFHLGHFSLYSKITWQQSSSDVLHLPKFVSNHSFYYEGKWFKKTMGVMYGVDISYFSTYYADQYMPAVGKYYWQNIKAIGNYPFVDLFFSMKIKRARVFIKSEHVNAGLMSSNYYLLPSHPAPGRSLKVGINWMFFD